MEKNVLKTELSYKLNTCQQTESRNHICSDCHKSFSTLSGLKQHRHIHETYKPFKCDSCSKSYTQFSNLCRHRRMHVSCRQHSCCLECGQNFQNSASLVKHRRFCTKVLIRKNNGFDRLYLNKTALINPIRQVHSLSSSPPQNSCLSPNQRFFNVSMPWFYDKRLPSQSAFFPNSSVPSPSFHHSSFPSASTNHPTIHPSFLIPSQNLTLSSQKTTETFKRFLLSKSFYENYEQIHKSIQMNHYNHELKKAIDDNCQNFIQSSNHPSSQTNNTANNWFDSNYLRLMSSLQTPINIHTLLNTLKTHQTSQREEEEKEDIDVDEDNVSANELTSNTSPTHQNNIYSSNLKYKFYNSYDNQSYLENHQSQKLSKNNISNGTQAITNIKQEDSFDQNNISPKLNPEVDADLIFKHHETHSNDQDDNISETHESMFEQSQSTLLHSFNDNQSIQNKVFKKTLKVEDGVKGLQPLDLSKPCNKSKKGSYMISNLLCHHSPNKKESQRMSEDLLKNKKDYEKDENLNDMRKEADSSTEVQMRKESTPSANTLNRDKKLSKEKNKFKLFSKHFKLHERGISRQFMRHRHSQAQKRMFSNRGYFSTHRCKFCDKIFPRSANLTRHLRTHTGEQPYKCRQCQRSFSISSNMQRHVRNVHKRLSISKASLSECL